jgi:two-component system, sensor histidine kinase and response regulator
MTDAQSATVLIVDDNPTNLSVLMAFLQEAGYTILVSTDGNSALERADYAQPDIILLDVLMPDIDGFETCRRLKAQATTADIPVIFMTALTETDDKLSGFEAGAVDYITKPLNRDEVLARVETHLKIDRQRREISALRERDRQNYERLSAMKDEFVHAATHDLRNPLTVITYKAYFLEKLCDSSDDKVRKHLDGIKQSIVKMRELIADMLDIARIETGNGLNRQPVALDDYLRGLLVDLSLVASEKDIELHCLPPDTLPTMQLDTALMGRALTNLVENAIKYTPAGGTVSVHAVSSSDHVRLSISDTGMGIPTDDLPHIFDKFYRSQHAAHQEQEGTGLGLAITKSIVEQHDGTISVDSRLGEGTTFTIHLPLPA